MYSALNGRPIVGQITAILQWNRANRDTSTKFGVMTAKGILNKSARLANWKFKMAVIFQDGRQKASQEVGFLVRQGSTWSIWVILVSIFMFYGMLDHGLLKIHDLLKIHGLIICRRHKKLEGRAALYIFAYLHTHLTDFLDLRVDFGVFWDAASISDTFEAI